MKYTRIGLAIIFLFISIMLVMIAARDSENKQAYDKDEFGQLSKVTSRDGTVDCDDTSSASDRDKLTSSTNITITCSKGAGVKENYLKVFYCPKMSVSNKPACAGGTTPCCVACNNPNDPNCGVMEKNEKKTEIFNSQSLAIGKACGCVQWDITMTDSLDDIAGGRLFCAATACADNPISTPTSTPIPGVTTTPTNTPAATLTPTRPPTASNTPIPPTATQTPTNTPTDSPTPTPSNTPTGTTTPSPTHTPKPTNTPTVAPSPTPGPVCAPTECGVCGWKDVAGLCHEGGLLPNGTRCCYKACAGNACTARAGNALDSCASDAGCTGPTQPPVIASVGYKCDAKCGICGISDNGGLCADMTSLPGGGRCCHNACVNQSCVQVSGQNIDRCVSAADCVPGAPPVAIAPPVVPQPKPPVTGSLPWYIIAIPAGILLLGIVL